jgi:CheY-like chemotaxis protein
MRMLLAEDNAVNQKAVCRHLEKLGYQVDIAENGLKAVDAWQTKKYDLILMDCQMPTMDGLEATRRIRELEVGAKRIPIVALTAHAMKGVDDECKAAGVDDYLSKPINRSDLKNTLDRWFNQGFAAGGMSNMKPVESAIERGNATSAKT